VVLNRRYDIAQIGVKLVATRLKQQLRQLNKRLRVIWCSCTIRYLIAPNSDQILEIKLLFDTILSIENNKTNVRIYTHKLFLSSAFAYGEENLVEQLALEFEQNAIQIRQLLLWID
jgi:hypothetical protein